MKTIKKGKKFFDKPWIGNEVRCSNCEGEFRLVSRDKVKECNDHGVPDGFYYVICSNCKAYIIFKL